MAITVHGSGPVYWSLENVAAAIAKQEGWHDGARDSFLKTMAAEASTGELVVRDPHTDLVVKPNVVRTWYDLVSLADLNEWLEKKHGVSYRWHPSQATLADMQSSGPPFKQKERMQEDRILEALRAANYDPLALPKPARGAPGVKSEIRAEVTKDKSLYGVVGGRFDPAWERLRKSRQIADSHERRMK